MVTKQDMIDAVCEACPHAREDKKQKDHIKQMADILAKSYQSVYDSTYKKAVKLEKKVWRAWFRKRGWRTKSVDEIARSKALSRATQDIMSHCW